MQKFSAVKIEVAGNGFVLNLSPHYQETGMIRTIEDGIFVFESLDSLVNFLRENMKDTGTGGPDRKHETK